MLTRLRNTLHYLRFHRVHASSPEKIGAWQEKRLLELLPVLVKNIPLYRDILREHGVSAEDVRSHNDLEKLPVISRETFSGKFIEEYADRSEPSRGTWAVTKGKNGALISIHRRPHLQTPLYADSLQYRFVFWDEPWRMHAEWLKVAHVQDIVLEINNHIGVETEEYEKNKDAAIKKIIDFQPDVLETYPSILAEIAHACAGKLPLRYAISTGEPLSKEVRRETESRLGCKIFDRYDLKEFGAVAVECREHDGRHISVESFVVEILDDKGNKLPDGKEGRIIVTDLLNFQMPLVRYDTGDRGRVSGEQCACGLACPRLWLSTDEDTTG